MAVFVCVLSHGLAAGEIVTTIGINDGTNKFPSVNLYLTVLPPIGVLLTLHLV